MRMMKILFLIAVLFTFGCSTISEQTTDAFYHLQKEKVVNIKTVTLTEVNAFAPTTTVQFVLECEEKVNEDEMPRCQPADMGRQNTTPGVVTGFGSSVVSSAAIVGGAYFVGKGIGESGDLIQNLEDGSSLSKVVENGGTLNHFQR